MTDAREQTTATNRQRIGALATVTVVGGSILVNGSPIQAEGFEVTNTNATGPGSLAQAVLDANANGEELDTITFATGVSGTISLDAELRVQYDLNIVGPGRDAITLTNPDGDVLYLYNEASLSVSGLTFSSIATYPGARDNDAIAVQNGGDLTLDDIEILPTGDGLDASGLGDVAISNSTISATDVNFEIDPGNTRRYTLEPIEIEGAASVSLSNITSVGAEADDVPFFYYGGDPRIELRYIGEPASLTFAPGSSAVDPAEVVLDISGLVGEARIEARHLYGDVVLTGSELRRVDIEDAGDVSVTDSTVAPGRELEVRRTDSLMVSGVELLAEGYATGRLDIRDTGRGITPDASGDVSISDVTGAGRIQAWNIEGSMSVTDISMAGEARSSVGANRVRGDIMMSDVDLDTFDATVTVSRNLYLPLTLLDSVVEESGVVSMSNVTVGQDGGNGIISLYNLSESRREERGGPSMALVESFDSSVANATLDDVTVFGSIRVTSSDVIATNVTVAPGTSTRGGYFYRNLTDGETTIADGSDELRGDGPTPIRVIDAGLELNSSTIAGQKAESAIELLQGDLNANHTTFGDMDLSIATVQASTESTMELNHTVLAPTGPDGAFLAEAEYFGKICCIRGVVESETPFTLAADYSLLPTGALESAGTNVLTDDARMGPLQDNTGDQLTVLPLAGSPAVNGGDPAIADAPASDQRGLARINEIIDIGSTESSPLLESIAPARFVDTRDGQDTIDGEFEGGGKRASGSTYEVQIAGRGEVPVGATSVVMNITSIAPDSGGFVTAFACDADQPTASSLNFAPGSNVGNEIVAGLSADGEVCLFTQGSTHLTVDVVAYSAETSAVQPVVPARAFESRIGKTTADGRLQGTGRLAAGSTQTVAMAGRNGVPEDAAAVIVNVTAIKPDSNGFLTLHACLPTTPLASSLNFTAGSIRGNEVIVELDEFGDMCIFASTGTDVTLDVVGYLPVGAIETVTPARLLETRDGQTTADGASQGGGPVAAGSTTTLPVAGRSGIPADAKSVVINVTAINPSARGFVTVSPCVTPTPTASSLNYEAGVSGGNEIIAEVDGDGNLCLFSSASTNLSVDVVAFIR